MRDSTPSAVAERVLATIPEPLSPSQQVPPPPGTGTLTARAPEAAYDTLRVERPSGGDSSAVPVPSLTQPLGNSPQGTLTMPDTLMAPLTAPPAAAAAPAANPSPATGEPANPAGATATTPATEECWRVQVAAPEDKAMADSRSAAAQSLLLVPMAITYEKGLYKVRTRECLTHAAADALKQRAVDSGFAGAFLLNPAVAAAPPAAKPAAKPHLKPKPKPKSKLKPSAAKHPASTTRAKKPAR